MKNDYEDGVIADTDGTWLADRDGPVAMIMPADPQIGDVYRPENIPGQMVLWKPASPIRALAFPPSICPISLIVFIG